MVANVINFIYNAYLGRALSFEDYATLTLVNTSYYFVYLFIQSLGNTVNHRVAFLSSEKGKSSAYAFFQFVLRYIYWIGALSGVVILLLIPSINQFFRLDEGYVFLFFTPLVFVGMYSAMARGYLAGTLLFSIVAFTTLFEALVKLLSAIALVSAGLEEWAYVSVPFSLVVACILLFFLVRHYRPVLVKVEVDSEVTRFPKKFYLASVFNGLAITAFLSLDVILAKHYLSTREAGEYAVLSLVGKMVYFFGSMFNAFIVTFTSRDMGKHKATAQSFAIIFGLTALFTIGPFVALGIFGKYTVPFLFGHKSLAIIPYALWYCLSIALFTLTTTIVNYRVTKHQYVFSVMAVLISLLVFFGILVSHQSIAQIVQVITVSSVFGFVLVGGVHALYGKGKYVKRVFVDLQDLFSPRIPDELLTTTGKRILVFNWRDTQHKYAGGAEVYVHELAKRWVLMGNQVTVFSGNDGHSPRYEVIDNVHIVRRGGFYFVYIWAFLYYIMKFRGRYDVIIDCENGVPFFTPLYTTEKQFLLIHHVHQDVFRKSLIPPFSYIAQFMECTLMPFVYKHVRVITVSPSSKKEILEHELTKHAVEIVYNGVDVDFFTPGEKSAHPTILYLGRLKKYKSVDVLLNAAQKIFEKVPNAQLLIAGEGEEHHRLQQLADRLGISDKVEFLGRVSEEMKGELYKTAWVFVNPSYMEGWGITTIEANACGTPIVASRVAGLVDSVKNPHTGFLVTYGDVDAFAERIGQLLTDTRLRTQMSQEAIVWAGEFTWEKSAKKALEVLFS
jgi:glycosyltransferase involved in cell wall biosynthesis/O-antigen/teichoic acid export membrane protein